MPQSPSWTSDYAAECARRRRHELMLGFGLALIVSIVMLLAVNTSYGATRHCLLTNNGRYICAKKSSVDLHHRHQVTLDANGNAVVIGHRPRGCPWAYCGCGLRDYLRRLGLAGMNDRSLNVADNWLRKFPRSYAHAGAVAVRRYHIHGHGHVMLLVRHIQGSIWRVREYNGYRHLSYLHDRSVRGFAFVDPRGSSVASVGF